MTHSLYPDTQSEKDYMFRSNQGWRSGVRKNAALLAIVAAPLLVALWPRAASATGYWKVSSIHASGQQTLYPGFAPPIDDTVYDTSYDGVNSYSPGGVADATFTATFDWVPSQPGETSTDLVVDTTARAEASGDPPILENEYGTQTEQGPDLVTYSLTGSRSKKLASAGATTATLTVHLKAQNVDDSFVESILGPRTANAIVDVSFNIDDRYVTLSRRDARGETMDADGTMHGDTIYSYTDTYRTADLGEGLSEATNPVPNWQQFDANLFGSWSEYVNFSWEPAYSSATQIWNQWEMIFGSENLVFGGWNGSAQGPTQRTLTYHATDPRDGTDAVAKYILTIHDPVEPDGADAATNIEKNLRALGGPMIRNETDQTQSEPGGSYAVSQSYSIGVSIGGDSAVSIWKLTQLGFTVDYSIEVSTQVTQTAPSVDVPAGYYTYLEIYDTYTNHKGNVKKWDAGGYVGESSYDFDVPLPPGYGIRMADPQPWEN